MAAAVGADGRRAGLEAAAAAAAPPERGGGSCVLCCGDLEATALGRCDHPVCYRCSTKMRVLCEQRYCAVCREELRQVRCAAGRRVQGSGPAWGRGLAGTAPGRRGSRRPEGDFAFLVSGRTAGGSGFQKRGLEGATGAGARQTGGCGASGAGGQELAELGREPGVFLRPRNSCLATGRGMIGTIPRPAGVWEFIPWVSIQVAGTGPGGTSRGNLFWRQTVKVGISGPAVFLGPL